jgi:hypothetical protein
MQLKLLFLHLLLLGKSSSLNPRTYAFAQALRFDSCFCVLVGAKLIPLEKGVEKAFFFCGRWMWRENIEI